jgi:hypothetical protein
MSPKPSVSRHNEVKRSKFLAALTLGKSVKEAAAHAEISRRTAYDWKDQDGSFRTAWEDTIAESIEHLEDEVRARALDRNDKNSHILLMFLLKKHKPEYRENHKREVTVKHEKVLELDFSTQDMDEAIRILGDAKKAASPPASLPDETS